MTIGPMKIVCLTAVLLLVFARAGAIEHPEPTDTITADSLHEEKPRKLSLIRRIVRGFDRLDDRYIEPQHYVFTAMLQTIYYYDFYTMRAGDGNVQTITFAPDANVKMGPYIGWKWFFAGYTLDLRSMKASRNRQELNLSIYSSQIGVDLIYRSTGSDYKLRVANFGSGIDVSSLEGVAFDGVKAGTMGVDVYYIFNHGRFSYPAAFAQSTRQKVSCGSWMGGVGYTKNTLDLDYEKLQDLVSERLAPQQVALDSGLMFRSVSYHDFNVSAGYAYNWVFAPKWVLCASGQAAISYKKTTGDMADDNRHGFDFQNINLNGIGRFALVYNNDRWYAGFGAIVRMHNYRKQRFSSSNTFGFMNLYMGYNFGLKKKYRTKK